MPRDVSKGVDLIKRFEGIEDGDPTTANLDPYICPGGYWTIGWGHAIIDATGTIRAIHLADLSRFDATMGVTRATVDALLGAS